MNDPLSIAFSAFQLDNDQQAMFEALQMFGDATAPQKMEFPFCHRICDIKLFTESYRVLRFVRDDNSLQLSIQPTCQSSEKPGVPFKLRDGGLRRWIKDESAKQDGSDEPDIAGGIGEWGMETDWNKYWQIEYQEQIEQSGYCIIGDVFGPEAIQQLLKDIDLAIERGTEGNIKNSRGETYAARNMAELNPQLCVSWMRPELLELLENLLGECVGLVRVLYFDKHPNRTWSLPWHKDMTIAVKDNSPGSTNFTKPTRKSGVDHVEAPTTLLENMLTLRIHLDEVTSDNGPLEVISGSHKNGKKTDSVEDANAVQTKIIVNAGDVLAMRPLLSHASGSSTPGTLRHRRILHLEFCGTGQLPDEFRWHMFHRIDK